jgi:hypothetical protein
MSRNRLTTTSRFPGLGELRLRTTFGTLLNFKYNVAIIALLRFTVTFDRAGGKHGTTPRAYPRLRRSA